VLEQPPMDPTIIGSPRAEVRGGKITALSGDASVARLVVGPEPLVIGRHTGCAMVLFDRKVSGTHLEVMATEHGLRVRDLGSRNGTYLDDHRVVEMLITKAVTLRCGDTSLEFRPGRPERVPLSKADRFGPLTGATPHMRALFEKLRMIAPTGLSVLVQGETGTGKELVAQAIHEASDRARRPFVVIDCGAIPASLAESTLFGHEKGAFTGAGAKRVSPFVEASGGTVFLDELGELPLDLQPKLLRLLAEQRVKSVGSNRYEPVDVRVIAATRRDLLEDINEGSFRDDLYFRVAQARIDVPPLRERADDIAPLVRRMLDDLGKSKTFRRITPESFDRLQRHDWPGNVRELRNVVTVAMAYDRGGRIDLAEHIGQRPAPEARRKGTALHNRAYADSKREHDKAFFTALYDATEGNLAEMSRRAEINRETVRIYLRQLRVGPY
jgi:DNA-binding NtrC family response regulator